MSKELRDRLSQPVVDIYNSMEHDLLVNMATLLSSKKELLATDPEAWKLQQMKMLGLLDTHNLQVLKKATGMTSGEINKVLISAGVAILGPMENALKKATKKNAKMLIPNPIEESPQLIAIMKAYERQAANSLNLVNSKLLQGSKQAYFDVINRATADVLAGTKTHEQALRSTIAKWSETGIPVFTDKLGRNWSPEGYVRTMMISTISNSSNAMQDERFKEYGVELVEISSHSGARPKCAPHQGRIFALGDHPVYPNLYRDTSYGQPDGLFGINCGHSKYAYFEGISIQHELPKDSPEQNEKIYKESQKQREIERSIRKAKTRLEMMKAIGDAQGILAAKRILANRQAKMRDFIDDTGRTRRRYREQIMSPDKSKKQLEKDNAIFTDAYKETSEAILKAQKHVDKWYVPSKIKGVSIMPNKVLGSKDKKPTKVETAPEIPKHDKNLKTVNGGHIKYDTVHYVDKTTGKTVSGIINALVDLDNIVVQDPKSKHLKVINVRDIAKNVTAENKAKKALKLLEEKGETIKLSPAATRELEKLKKEKSKTIVSPKMEKAIDTSHMLPYTDSLEHLLKDDVEIFFYDNGKQKIGKVFSNELNGSLKVAVDDSDFLIDVNVVDVLKIKMPEKLKVKDDGNYINKQVNFIKGEHDDKISVGSKIFFKHTTYGQLEEGEVAELHVIGKTKYVTLKGQKLNYISYDKIYSFEDKMDIKKKDGLKKKSDDGILKKDSYDENEVVTIKFFGEKQTGIVKKTNVFGKEENYHIFIIDGPNEGSKFLIKKDNIFGQDVALTKIMEEERKSAKIEQAKKVASNKGRKKVYHEPDLTLYKELGHREFRDLYRDSHNALFNKEARLREDLRTYTGGSYTDINDYLRRGESLSPTLKRLADKIEGRIREHALPLKDNTIFMRNINGRDVGAVFSNENLQNLWSSFYEYSTSDKIGLKGKNTIEEIKNLMMHAKFSDKAVLSTSREKGIFNKYDGVEIIIAAPKGYRGGIFVEEISKYKSEAEYVIAPNEEFRVFDVAFDPNDSHRRLKIFVTPINK